MVTKAITVNAYVICWINMNMSKREQEKAIEDTKKVAEEAKRVEDKVDAVETLQEVAPQVAAQIPIHNQ